MCGAILALTSCGTIRATSPAEQVPGAKVAAAARQSQLSPRQPARPAGTLLPSGIRAVVVTAVPGLNDKKKPPAPVTVTDPGRVRQLVSLVNGLPLSPPGIYYCPMDDGRGVRLAFLARPGGAVLAAALAKANGCGGVALTIGHSQPTGLGSGSTAAQQALTISGLPWRLSGYLP
jgi:hypothetical protein